MRVRLLLVLIAITTCGACSQPGQTPQSQKASADPTAGAARETERAPTRAAEPSRDRVRDLSADESMGGHTLTRHVGRTDAELAERLQREQISAASTWTDRETAERAVGAALASADGRLTSWERRQGRRPNLVLHYTDRSGATLGRSLSRGERTAVPCTRALVVLKWDERRDRFYVLTAYPEADR